MKKLFIFFFIFIAVLNIASLYSCSDDIELSDNKKNYSRTYKYIIFEEDSVLNDSTDPDTTIIDETDTIPEPIQEGTSIGYFIINNIKYNATISCFTNISANGIYDTAWNIDFHPEGYNGIPIRLEYFSGRFYGNRGDTFQATARFYNIYSPTQSYTISFFGSIGGTFTTI